MTYDEMEIQNRENDKEGDQPTISVEKNPTFNEMLQERKRNNPVIYGPPDLKVFLSGQSSKAHGIHKDLFIMASQVFEDLLDQCSAVNEGRYSVKLDMELSVFKVLKSFLYDGCLNNQTIDLTTALKVLDSAVVYQVHRLIPCVSQVAMKKVTSTDVFKVLEAGRRLSMVELESEALDYIWSHTDECLQADSFYELGSYDVCRILSSDALQCDEDKVLDSAIRWAKHKANSDSEVKLKRYFHEVAHCVRFPLVSSAALALQTVATNVINVNDVTKLFQNICIPEDSKHMVPLESETRPRRRSTKVPTESDSVLPIDADEDVNVMLPPVSPVKRRECQQQSTPSTAKEGGVPKKNRLSRMDKDSVVSFASTTTSSDGMSASLKSHETDDSKDDEDLFYEYITKRTDKQSFDTYDDMVRKIGRCEKKSRLGCISYSINISKNYRTVYMPECKKVHIEMKCNFSRVVSRDRNFTFLRFVKHFDLMRYLVFNNTEDDTKLYPENIWSLQIDFLLKLHGVTFLNMCHPPEEVAETSKGGKLVMNYLSDSLLVLKNEKMRLSNLAVSNSEFNLNFVRETGKYLEQLILYRVWGTYTIDDVLKRFQNLTSLIFWKHEPNSNLNPRNSTSRPPPACLNFAKVLSDTARTSLKKLVLFQVELKFTTRNNNVETNITDLFLDGCFSQQHGLITSVAELFHLVFPKLKNVVIINKVRNSPFDKEKLDTLAFPALINCIRNKIVSIESIKVMDMDWSCNDGEEQQDNLLDMSEVSELQSFLQTIGLPENPKSFLLEKVGDVWRGTVMEDGGPIDEDGGYWSERDLLEFEWYELNHFYDSFEVYEDYFLQDNEQFPKPILWI